MIYHGIDGGSRTGAHAWVWQEGGAWCASSRPWETVEQHDAIVREIISVGGSTGPWRAEAPLVHGVPQATIAQARDVGLWEFVARQCGATLELVPSSVWRACYVIPDSDAKEAARRSREWAEALWPDCRLAAGDHESDARLIAISQSPEGVRWAQDRARERAPWLLVAARRESLGRRGAYGRHSAARRSRDGWTERDVLDRGGR